MDVAFGRAVDEALRRAVPGVFVGASVTTVIADARDPERLAAVLGRLLAILPRAGVPRGRVTVLLAAGAEGRPAEHGLTARLRASLGVPVLAHDPAHSACFVAGRVDALAVELNDELREAESVLACGPLAGGEDAEALRRLAVPGLASLATRAALAARPSARAAAAATVAVDLAIGWRARAHGAWEVLAT